MTTSVDLQPGEESWVPVEACLLPTTEQPRRVFEFDGLFAAGLTSVQRTGADQVRLVLSGSAGVRDQAQDLANRETRCCSFFGFTLTTPVPDTVFMDIAVPADRVDVLTALADRAEAHLTQSEAR